MFEVGQLLKRFSNGADVCQFFAEKEQRLCSEEGPPVVQGAKSAAQGPRPEFRSKEDLVDRSSPPPYTVTPSRLNADCDLNVKPTEVIACEAEANDSMRGNVPEENVQEEEEIAETLVWQLSSCRGGRLRV